MAHHFQRLLLARHRGVQYLQEQRFGHGITVELAAECRSASYPFRDLKGIRNGAVNTQRNAFRFRKFGHQREDLRDHMHMVMAVKMRRLGIEQVDKATVLTLQLMGNFIHRQRALFRHLPDPLAEFALAGQPRHG